MIISLLVQTQGFYKCNLILRFDSLVSQTENERVTFKVAKN